MSWLLDTHTLLWAVFDPQKLTSKAKGIIQDPRNRVLVSYVNYWEVSLKYGLGKLALPDTTPEEIPVVVREMGVEELALAPDTLASYHRLPLSSEHRDPFDRLLIWEAIVNGHRILSRDPRFRYYREHGLKVDW